MPCPARRCSTASTGCYSESDEHTVNLVEVNDAVSAALAWRLFPRSVSGRVNRRRGIVPTTLVRAGVIRLSGGGYQIFGWDEKGELRPDLTVSHRFTGVQRVMSSAGAPETASAGDSR